MENYFREALHNFIFEEAGGGAIRHLADNGYTAKQIAEALSFPMPYEKIREAFTNHLLESGILLKEKPEEHKKQEKTEYVREYDKYGKPSFRRMIVPESEGGDNLTDGKAGGGKWKEMELSEFLLLYKEGMGGITLSAETEHRKAEKNVYIACHFAAARTAEELQGLDKRQQEYIQGICWTNKTMYHLLDRRMLDIAVKLQKMGQACESRNTGENLEEGTRKTAGYTSGEALIGKVYIRH